MDTIIESVGQINRKIDELSDDRVTRRERRLRSLGGLVTQIVETLGSIPECSAKEAMAAYFKSRPVGVAFSQAAFTLLAL